jgi:hypothetical protein
MRTFFLFCLRAYARVSKAKLLGALLVAVLGVSGWLVLRPYQVGAKPPLPKALQVEAQAPIDAALDAGVPVPQQSATTATITFMTVPYVTSTVTWGKKPLGKILPGKPLVIVRPRDSGPLDVMVRSAGYLSVQTRAHTFSDTRVAVKLTPISKKNEVLGYRVPLDAGLDGAIEGGVALEGGQFPIMPPYPAPLQAPATTPAPVTTPAPAPPSMF